MSDAERLEVALRLLRQAEPSRGLSFVLHQRWVREKRDLFAAGEEASPTPGTTGGDPARPGGEAGACKECEWPDADCVCPNPDQVDTRGGRLLSSAPLIKPGGETGPVCGTCKGTGSQMNGEGLTASFSRCSACGGTGAAGKP